MGEAHDYRMRISIKRPRAVSTVRLRVVSVGRESYGDDSACRERCRLSPIAHKEQTDLKPEATRGPRRMNRGWGRREEVHLAQP